MGIETIDGIRGWMEPFPIHFDLNEHYIPLEVFVRTAKAASVIADNMNEELFHGQVLHRVVVFPAEYGTFKSKLGIFVFAGAIAWHAMESDIGKAFVEGLTGHQPAYWSKMAGEEVAKLPSKLKVKLHSSVPFAGDQLASDDVECVATAKIISETTRSILETKPEIITKVGITKRHFSKSIRARSSFYKACLEFTELNAVGFSEEDEFPVPRNEFARYATDPDETSDPQAWNVEMADLQVTSPNWDQSDKHRLWKAKTSDGKDRYFKIEDTSFWQLVEREKIQLKGKDSIRVQWAFRSENEKARDFRVLKVVRFNGKSLGDPLAGVELQELLGNLDPAPMADLDQPDLFDHI